MKVEKKPTLSWEEAPDVIGTEELMQICGIGKNKALEIFKDKNLPKIPSTSYRADKEAVRMYLQGIKIKDNSKEAINYMILLELQKLNQKIEGRN